MDMVIMTAWVACALFYIRQLIEVPWALAVGSMEPYRVIYASEWKRGVPRLYQKC